MMDGCQPSEPTRLACDRESAVEPNRDEPVMMRTVLAERLQEQRGYRRIVRALGDGADLGSKVLQLDQQMQDET